MKLKSGYIILLIALSFRAVPVYSFDMGVSLYNSHLVQSLVFTVVDGYFRISGEGTKPFSMGPGSSCFFLHSYDTLYVRNQEGNWFCSNEIQITGEEGSVFSLKPSDPVLDSREYHGDLALGISMRSLRIINLIDLETYIMGVAEAEAGPRCPLEYYKVQAILSRTFALRNLERHLEEGFNLCDGVHCQAYKGRHVWNEDVEIGTEVTSGLVLCDRDTVLINPVYHSNSGGETRGAGEVWLKEESYLLPVLDPFSNGQQNSNWERSMHIRDWLMYLLSYEIRFGEKADTAGLEMRLNHRQEYYRVFDDSIDVSNIRKDFNYRSDFFDVIVDGEMVRIRGRGYGHGVGLSQEGAIEMSRRRYHYTAILNYYYHEIQIVPYFFLDTDAGLEGNPLFSH
ncbi:MAG TPA: SpoIID/LytB domain-containing protein [Bacteroides sp.]|nr:SpoIID/LytB domain-containing protein [Bacteroides sp.]